MFLKENSDYSPVYDFIASKAVYIIFVLVLLLIVTVIFSYSHIKNATYLSSLEVTSETSPEAKVLASHTVHVYISGAVVKPGVYALESGSLLADALAAAQGLKDTASALWISRNINLAEVIEEGAHYYFPYASEVEDNYSLLLTISAPSTTESVYVPSPAGPSAPPPRVNVNTADSTTLDTLGGIGPAYASKIVMGRPYKDFADLVGRSGVPKSILEKISEDLDF